MHATLAEASGNRVLERLTLVLLQLTRIHQGPTPRRSFDSAAAGDLARVHERIVDAVVDGDMELARIRMRRHLEALADFVA